MSYTAFCLQETINLIYLKGASISAFKPIIVSYGVSSANRRFPR